MQAIRVETRAERVLENVLDEMRRQCVDTSELARRWGVSLDWAEGRLSGKKGLTGSELGHIADALGVPAGQLAGE